VPWGRERRGQGKEEKGRGRELEREELIGLILLAIVRRTDRLILLAIVSAFS
jgi:hypothetical protein